MEIGYQEGEFRLTVATADEDTCLSIAIPEEDLEDITCTDLWNAASNEHMLLISKEFFFSRVQNFIREKCPKNVLKM